MKCAVYVGSWQAARILGISQSTLYWMRRSGELRADKVLHHGETFVYDINSLIEFDRRKRNKTNE
jgi:hypothetical protein